MTNTEIIMSSFQFNRYVSLGSSCRTRFQIDRHFSTRYVGYQPPKGFFDWLWGGGIDGVIKVIKKDFNICANNLVVKKAGGTTQVYDESTGFYFLHDFVFSEEGLLNLELANQEMLGQLDEFLRKYTVMAEKTKAFFKSEEKVCFVYHGKMNKSQIVDFFSVTTEMFAAKPMLLNIIPSNDILNDEEFLGFEDSLKTKIVNDEAAIGQPWEWMGVNESWDKVFHEFSII